MKVPRRTSGGKVLSAYWKLDVSCLPKVAHDAIAKHRNQAAQGIEFPDVVGLFDVAAAPELRDVPASPAPSSPAPSSQSMDVDLGAQELATAQPTRSETPSSLPFVRIPPTVGSVSFGLEEAARALGANLPSMPAFMSPFSVPADRHQMDTVAGFSFEDCLRDLMASL